MKISRFSLFKKMAFRSLKKSWSQFLAILAIGTIAVTLFVGLKANALSLEKRVEATYSLGNMADLWVTSSSYNEEEVSKMKDLASKKDATMEGRFVLTASLGSHNVITSISPSLPKISQPYDIKYLKNHDKTRFFLLDEAIIYGGVTDEKDTFALGKEATVIYDLSQYQKLFSTLSGILKLDDYFLRDSNPFLLNKWSLNFVVTGSMKYPENIAKAAYGTSTILIDNDTFLSSLKNFLNPYFRENLTASEKENIFHLLGEVFSELGYFKEENNSFSLAPNQYLFASKNKENINDLNMELKELSKRKNSSIYSVNNRNNMPFFLTISSEISQAKGFTYLFPFVFFFVATLVILTTASQMIVKERHQIGTLKALGVSKREILLFYMSLILIVVFLGILLGEILGPFIIPWIMGNKYELIYTLSALKYVFPIFEGLLVAFLFLAISALTAYLVIIKEVRLSPSESMLPVTPSFKAKKDSPFKKENSLFLSLKMAFRNIRANLLKSLMVIVGVMGCTSLLVTGFGIEDTVYNGIDQDLAMCGQSALNLTFSEGKKKSEFAEEIKDISSISSYELFLNTTGNLTAQNGYSASLNIFLLSGDSSNTHFGYARGLNKDEIALGKKYSESLSLKVGDIVTFSLGSLSYEVTIGQIYEAFSYNGLAIFSSASCFKNKDFVYNASYIDVKERSSIEEVKNELKAKVPSILKSVSKEDWREKINNLLNGILVMTLAVKVFAILLALVVLYNLSLLNFNERYREIATLKVLGFNLREISLSLLFETMTLTIIGISLGLLLGYPFLLATMSLNKVELVYYIYSISPFSYLGSFLLTFIVAFLTNLYFGRKSKKVPLVESLKSVA